MQLDKRQFNKCQKAITLLGEKGLSMNHYQLAANTEIDDPIIWKHFLMDPAAQDYIQSEMNIIRNAAINEIIQHTSDSKSVGQAQLINALTGMDQKYAKKEGPAFIYCYVPLNEQQAQAPNIMPFEAPEEKKPERKKEEKFEFKNLSD